MSRVVSHCSCCPSGIRAVAGVLAEYESTFRIRHWGAGSGRSLVMFGRHITRRAFHECSAHIIARECAQGQYGTTPYNMTSSLRQVTRLLGVPSWRYGAIRCRVLGSFDTHTI